MPRKNAMRDSVNAVRSQLPNLYNLSREKIELALLYYDLNVDETVEAFKRNGAIEALGGWTEMNSNRGNNANKRSKKPPSTLDKNLSLQILPSNGVLRPSQRVANIFQTFAGGNSPTTITIASTPTSSATTCSSLSSPTEQNRNDVQLNSVPVHHSILNNSYDLTILKHVVNSTESIAESPTRRQSIKNRHNSSSSTKNESRSSNSAAFNSNNRKLLTKSSKDLQRQTSTLANVEMLFNNEIKSSIKRVDDTFKQIHEILKQREIDLYLEIDKVKEQGLNIIHHRQQRAIELRQRMDRCELLQPNEIEILRNDIKQFVTDRRYDLVEELSSSHRFEFDQKLIDSLKTFGHVSSIDRKQDRSASISTSTPLIEINSTSSIENIQNPVVNGRPMSVSSSSKQHSQLENQQKPLPQRMKNKGIGDNQQNGNLYPDTNGHFQNHDDSFRSQNNNYRRSKQHFERGNHQENPIFNYHNKNNRSNPKRHTNKPVNTPQNDERTSTSHQLRPSSNTYQTTITVET